MANGDKKKPAPAPEPSDRCKVCGNVKKPGEPCPACGNE